MKPETIVKIMMAGALVFLGIFIGVEKMRTQDKTAAIEARLKAIENRTWGPDVVWERETVPAITAWTNFDGKAVFQTNHLWLHRKRYTVTSDEPLHISNRKAAQ